MSADAGLGRNAAVMAAGTATSRVLGVVRASVLVGVVGGINAAGGDAFAVANWLPNMLYMLIAGGVLNAVLVPQIVRAYRSATGQEYVDRLLTLSIVLLAAVTAVLTLATPVIIAVAVSGDEPQFVRLARAFAFLCIPQVFFYGLYTLLGQVLNARGNFGPYMWAPVVNNIVAIAGMVVFVIVFGRVTVASDLTVWDGPRIALLAGTATLGVIAQAAVLVIPLYRSGFRYRPRRDWRGSGLGTAGRVAGWIFAALAVGQLGILVVTRIASAAAQVGGGDDIPGTLAYTNAFTMFMLPHSLVTVSLVTALFTRLSDHAAARDVGAVRADFSSGLRTIAVFTLFAAPALAVLALPIVRVVFPSSTAADAGSMTPVVVAFMAGLVALGAWSLCQRVFYAYEDAKGLFRIQVVMAGVVVVAAVLGYLVLDPRWWVACAAAGISASYLLGAVWGGAQVWRRLGGGLSRIIRLHVRAGLAAVMAAALGWLVSRAFGDLAGGSWLKALAACVVVGAVMLGTYLWLLRRFQVSELDDLLTPLMARLRRSMSTPATVRAQELPDAEQPQPSARAVATAERGGDRLDTAIGRGTLLAGRYRLHQPVSTDLPGVECWTARDQILDRPVRALVLRSGPAAAAQDSARRAALVSDPRLLRVLDVGDHEGVAYVVTEPVVGQDLGQLTARGPLPADQARAILGEAATALEVARRRGVHHLALRPSTVHVSPDGTVLVSGLAMDGEILDRPHGDAKATSRADTVGLVALLYLALTGRWPDVPSLGPVQGATTAPAVDGAPLPPTDLSAAVPNDLDTLCVVTLGPHDDGPHSPGELVRELEPWGAVDAQGIYAAIDGDSRAATVPSGPWDTGVGAVASAPGPVAGTGLGTLADAGPGALADAGPGAGVVPGFVPGVVPLPPDDPDAGPASGGSASGGSASGAPGEPLQPDAPDAPASVQRQSIRRPLGDESSPPVPHGTPPPAVPPTYGRTQAATSARSGVTSPVGGGAPGSGEAAPRYLPPGSQRSPDDFDQFISQPDRRPERKTINATPIVLLVIAAFVVVGLFWAWRELTAPAPPLGGEQGIDLTGDGANADTGGDVAEEPAGDGVAESPPPAEDPSTPPSTAPPVIASAQMIDPPPDGDNNEHPEAVPRAIDGDPSTFWFSRTYVSPTYGMKQGIGFAVTLAEPATVTTVTLLVNGTGGTVEVRATDPATPTEGDVLASGSLSPQTVLTLSEPTQTQSIVLWFTALPQTPDGTNRIELLEIQVS